jgi:hypothetical protein
VSNHRELRNNQVYMHGAAATKGIIIDISDSRRRIAHEGLLTPKR